MAAPGFRASKLILAGLALGALFFVASDLLLALILFVVIRPAQKRLLGHVLWAA